MYATYVTCDFIYDLAIIPKNDYCGRKRKYVLSQCENIFIAWSDEESQDVRTRR